MNDAAQPSLEASSAGNSLNEKKERKDANTCIALGAGVGALGVGSAILAGAVCPLCYVVAPGLIAIGAFKRARLSKNKSSKQ